MLIRMERGCRAASAADAQSQHRAVHINDAASRRVLECLNLRPLGGTDGTVLCPAGHPLALAGGSWRPLATDGDALIVADGCDLGIIYEASAAGAGGAVASAPELICTLDGEPRCVLVDGDRMTVMTAQGPWLMRRGADGRWVSAGARPVWPEVSITRAPKPSVSVTIAGGTMAQTAQRAMEAYRGLARQAGDAGCLMQPVLARCRVLDARGDVLHVTAPVALMPPEGAQLESPWTLNAHATDEASSADTIVSADTYALRVHLGACTDAAVTARAAVLEVQVSPEFHSIDPGGTATAAVTRHGSERRVTVTMPGGGRALTGGGRATASAQRLTRACAAFDKLAVTVARISNPFGQARTIDVAAALPATDVARAADALEKVLGQASEAPGAHRAVTAPHSFSARHVALNGRAAVWADVDVLPFAGYGPGTFAATTGTQAWSGTVRVDFADGTHAVRDCGGSALPLTLWPLISYPAGDARRLRMVWQAQGQSQWHSLDVELQPDSSGTCACYVHPTLKPFSPDDGRIATGTAVQPVRRLQGHVAVTAAGSSDTVTALACAGSAITALRAARSGGSAWDFGRARFYVFGPDATRLLTVNADRTDVSLNLLSTDRPENAACVADAGERVLVLCRGRLTAFSGTQAKALGVTGVSGNRLGYDAEADEIIVADTDDNEARVYLPARGMDSYSITLEASGAWLASGGRVYAVAGGSLCEVSRRRSGAEPLDVRWSARIEPAGGLRRRPRGVQWMVNGSGLDIKLNVRRTPLNGRTPLPACMDALTVSGDVLSPVRMRLGGHAPCAMVATVWGTAGPDFALAAPIFTFETLKTWK